MPYPENNAPSNDAELAIKLRDTGDANAFEILYKRHNAILSSFLFRLAGARAPALLPKMVERLRDRSYAIRDVENFHLWGLGVVASFWREETKHDDAPKESDPVAFQVIHRLPYYLRPVFILVHYFQMPIDDVAAALRIPRGTATSRLQDSFASLVLQLAPAEPQPPPLPEVEEPSILVEELPSSEVVAVAQEKPAEATPSSPSPEKAPEEAPAASSPEKAPEESAAPKAEESKAPSAPPPLPPPLFVSPLSPPPTGEPGSSLSALIPKLTFPSSEPPKEPEKS